jgi:hypothetical protein
MEFKDHPIYYSVLTNGEIDLEIQCHRNGCFIDPLPGVMYSIDSNGQQYLNGKPA